MGVYGEIKHGLLRDKKAVRNFFETLDRTQLYKDFHNFMLCLTNFQCQPLETAIPNQPYV